MLSLFCLRTVCPEWFYEGILISPRFRQKNVNVSAMFLSAICILYGCNSILQESYVVSYTITILIYASSIAKFALFGMSVLHCKPRFVGPRLGGLDAWTSTLHCKPGLTIAESGSLSHANMSILHYRDLLTHVCGLTCDSSKTRTWALTHPTPSAKS